MLKVTPAHVRCEVLLNVGPGALLSFEPKADRLARARFADAAGLDVPTAPIEQMLEYVWAVCNADPFEPELAVDPVMVAASERYRRARNRSLCMGDVVLVRPSGTAPLVFAAVTIGFCEVPAADFAATEIVDGHWSEFFGEGPPDLGRLGQIRGH